jgi:hypothetical protein
MSPSRTSRSFELFSLTGIFRYVPHHALLARLARAGAGSLILATLTANGVQLDVVVLWRLPGRRSIVIEPRNRGCS